MADIALMVADEFQKRVDRGGDRSAADGGAAPGGGGRNFAAVEKALSSWVESASAAVASGVRVNFAVRVSELEPMTGLALAAFDGFFSA